MKLDLIIYQWLLSLKCIPELQTIQGFVETDQQLTEDLQNGRVVTRVLQIMDPTINVDIKQGNTNGIRLFNWNNVSQAMEKINMSLDDDIKLAIVKGDQEMLIQFLKELQQHFQVQDQISVALSSKQQTEQKSQIIQEPSEIPIDSIDPLKPLNKTTSLLEFIIVSICQHFQMQPKQAITLLNQNYKLLSIYLIKGQKNSYKQVINWLMEISKSLEHILKFVEYKLDILLSLLRSGLVSQNNEVTHWTLYILNGILMNLPKQELLEDAYAWFIREHGGLIACILSQQRHPQQLDQICNLYVIISQYNVVDFFNIQLRKLLKSGKEYIDFINTIIEVIQNRDQLRDLQLFEIFSSHAIKLFEPQFTQPQRMSALKFFENYWIYYPKEFVLNQLDQYLLNSRKATRESSFTMKIFTYHSLFRILDHLAISKDSHAALLYKKLVFSLIENFDNKEIREFLVSNFLRLIKRYSTIPVDILIIPMVKQLIIEQNEVSINIKDFELLKEACTHPKIDLQMAILMLDMLSKLFLSSIIFYQVTYAQIQILFTRFIEQEQMRDFAFNLVKVALTEYYGNYTEANKPGQVNDDTKILRSQFRSQIIQLVKFIINLRSFELNEMIKPIIAHYYLEIQRQINTGSKALYMLLGYFGDPNQIIDSIKQSQIIEENSQIISTKRLQNNSTSNNSKRFQSEDNDPFKELRDEQDKPSTTMLGTLALSNDEQQLLKQFDLI